MSQQISIGMMIRKISGLAGTNETSDFEDEFIESMERKTNNGKDTTALTEKQIGIVESIHKKHFA